MRCREDRWYRSVDYRLYPNATQTKVLEHTLDVLCDLYNRLLDIGLESLKDGRRLTAFDMMKQATAIAHSDPVLKKDVYSTCRNGIAMRVVKALSGCFYVESEDSFVHRPRYKSKTRFNSFAYPQMLGFGFEGDRIKLSKIGDIRYRNDHHPKGEMRTCTVKRDAYGHWHAVVVYGMETIAHSEECFDHPKVAEGFDAGLCDILTDTEGTKVKAPDFYMQRENELARFSRRMSETEKGSPEWERARVKLSRFHLNIARERRGFMHKLSRDIVDSCSFIALEDLDVKRMKESDDNHRSTRKRYTEMSWGMLYGMIRYKAEEAGTEIMFVDPRNTSRTCSRCGNVKGEQPLTERTYRCGCCGMIMDRDRNAALNILSRGSGMRTLRQAVNGQPS